MDAWVYLTGTAGYAADHIFVVGDSAGGNLAGVGKALGQSIRDFKKEVKADDEPARKEEDKGGDAQ